jgi:hypothetical protein
LAAPGSCAARSQPVTVSALIAAGRCADPVSSEQSDVQRADPGTGLGNPQATGLLIGLAECDVGSTGRQERLRQPRWRTGSDLASTAGSSDRRAVGRGHLIALSAGSVSLRLENDPGRGNELTVRTA